MIDDEMRNRVRGTLIGLAVGDAVGTTVEFRAPGPSRAWSLWRFVEQRP